MDAASGTKVYLFGPFRLEVRERRLLRDGEPVPLLGKAFDTLVGQQLAGPRAGG